MLILRKKRKVISYYDLLSHTVYSSWLQLQQELQIQVQHLLIIFIRMYLHITSNQDV